MHIYAYIRIYTLLYGFIHKYELFKHFMDAMRYYTLFGVFQGLWTISAIIRYLEFFKYFMDDMRYYTLFGVFQGFMDDMRYYTLFGVFQVFYGRYALFIRYLEFFKRFMHG